MPSNLRFTSRCAGWLPGPFSSLVSALILGETLSVGLVGCATGTYEMLATVAGGEKIRVPLGANGAELANEGGVQIRGATFTRGPEQKILYAFAFTDSRRRGLRQVRVEDVSDDKAVLLVDDAQPKSESDGTWHGVAEPLEFKDPRMSWIMTISNTLRVFRFTLTFSDGQTLVLHQGTFYSPAMKSLVRHTYGETY